LKFGEEKRREEKRRVFRGLQWPRLLPFSQ